MRIRIFVSGSAAVLAAWLGVTFFRDVPRDNYPELGRSAPVSAALEVEEEELVMAEEPAVAMD